MPIVEKVRPYELLVSFDKAGLMKGAHLIKRSYLEDETGRVLNELPLAPEPVSIENLPDQGIMNDLQAAAVTTAQAHASRIEELELLLSGAEEISNERAQQIVTLQNSLSKMEDGNRELSRRIVILQDELAKAEAELNSPPVTG